MVFLDVPDRAECLLDGLRTEPSDYFFYFILIITAEKEREFYDPDTSCPL